MALASEVRRPTGLPPRGLIAFNPAFYTALWHPQPLKAKDPTGLTITNLGATWTLLNQGLYVPYFDGSDDKLTAPDDASLALGTADFTLLGWFKTGQSASNNYSIIQKINYASGYFGFSMDISNAYLTLCLGRGDGTINAYSAGITADNDDTWRLGGISVVRGGLASFYQQGALEGTANTAANTATCTNAHAVWIGQSDHFSKKYQGYIGEVVVIKGLALPAAQHREFYLRTKWRYGY